MRTSHSPKIRIYSGETSSNSSSTGPLTRPQCPRWEETICNFLKIFFMAEVYVRFCNSFLFSWVVPSVRILMSYQSLFLERLGQMPSSNSPICGSEIASRMQTHRWSNDACPCDASISQTVSYNVLLFFLCSSNNNQPVRVIEKANKNKQEDLPVAICITIMKKGLLSLLFWYSMWSISDNSPRNIDS